MKNNMKTRVMGTVLAAICALSGKRKRGITSDNSFGISKCKKRKSLQNDLQGQHILRLRLGLQS